MADDVERVGVSDGHLLRQYAEQRSEAAFAELVGRHVDWVYSSALRQVRDAHLAEDVTQAVFALLARKAGSFDERAVVGAWLFRAARYVSADALKARRRRAYHERELGAAMNRTRAGDDTAASTWSQVEPALDGALAKLGQRDRTAILLRFFERKTHAQVGAALGVSEDAAKMRVGRALEKLRALLTRGGGDVVAPATAAALSEALLDHCVAAAPAGLAGAVTSAATGTAPATGTAAGLPWTKGLVLAMTVSKTTAGAAVACAVILLFVVGAAVYRSGPAAAPRAAIGTPGGSALARPSPALDDDFVELYALAPGQAMRRVAPPFGGARRHYVESVLRPKAQPGMFGPEGPSALLFAWDEGAPAPLQLRGFQNDDPNNLGHLLGITLGARPYEFTAPPGLLDTAIEGDWVVRQTLPPPARAAELERVLRDELGLKLRIERKRASVEVIVVGGGGLAPMRDAVQVYSDKLTDGKADTRGAKNDFRDFMEQLALVTRKRVVNESSVDLKTEVRVALHTSGLIGKMPPQRAAAKLDLILRNLSRQTGLQFARAARTVDTWVVTPQN